MAQVGLIFGGRSAEHLVSVRSARAVKTALLAGGHTVVALAIDERGALAAPSVGSAVLDGDGAVVPRQNAPVAESYGHLLGAFPLDVVFPIVHGTFGEDGTLQGLLAMLDVACVGADTKTSAVCMDKVMCKRALRAAGVDVVEWASVDARTSREDLVAAAQELPAPWFVKPAVGGSSVGCQKASTPDELVEAVAFALRFDDTALIERCVVGRELEVAVLGPKNGLEASCIGEIVPGAEFYDYKDKYLDNKAGLLAPAPVDEGVAAAIRSAAIDAFSALGGVGMARVDFFLESTPAGARFMVNEINTLPGFTTISMYPRLWDISGRDMPALCTALVEAAQSEHRRQGAYHAAIGDFIAAIQADAPAS